MWKSIFDSVRGTSHEQSGTPCQDACRLVHLNYGADDVLIACASDGAGSASHSADGAELACDRFIELVTDYIAGSERTLPDQQPEAETMVREWLTQIRLDLEAKAAELQVDTRQLACTFLGAIVLADRAYFLQIGDGAIVREAEEGYMAVFWPQSGEYANTTNFVTSPACVQHLMVQIVEEPVDELAIITDGLERLILRFAEQTVHAPFLTPLFEPLRGSDNPDQFFEPLRNFLNSPAVNQRTDDDKTLVLATRRE